MLQSIEIMGKTIHMYVFWNTISTFVMFFYLVFQTKSFSMISPRTLCQSSPKHKTLISLGQILVIIIVAFGLFMVLNPAFGNWFTNGNANYYGSLTAWFVAITALAFVFKISPLKVHDLFAPALPLQLVFAKLACFFHGCCSSFEMAHSFYYNQANMRYEFPVQLVESIVALLLFFYLLSYKKKPRRVGSVFPVYLTAYSVSRFLTEFLRADFPNVLGPFDAYQIMSICFFVLGLVLLWIVHKWGDRINSHYEAILQKASAE